MSQSCFLSRLNPNHVLHITSIQPLQGTENLHSPASVLQTQSCLRPASPFFDVAQSDGWPGTVSATGIAGMQTPTPLSAQEPHDVFAAKASRPPIFQQGSADTTGTTGTTGTHPQVLGGDPHASSLVLSQTDISAGALQVIHTLRRAGKHPTNAAAPLLL